MHAYRNRTDSALATSSSKDPHAASAHLIASLEKELIRYMQQRYGQQQDNSPTSQIRQ
ncbi:MAG: hypothetical protein ABN482_06285 [Corticimicrobacter sp.]|uniref:hypothetical protein n=1 Tax=Corticimicrobacter sp. TaxID=2678536 RepID=UPI0032DBDEE0